MSQSFVSAKVALSQIVSAAMDVHRTESLVLPNSHHAHIVAE